MAGRASGADATCEAARKERDRGTRGHAHHLVELADLIPSLRDESTFGTVGRAKVRASMPESLDLCVGLPLPGTITTRDGEGKNAALEMVDLLGQLSTLAAVFARLAGPTRSTRPSRNRNGEHQRQYETDENAEVNALATKTKLHVEDIDRKPVQL